MKLDRDYQELWGCSKERILEQFGFLPGQIVSREVEYTLPKLINKLLKIVQDDLKDSPPTSHPYIHTAWILRACLWVAFEKDLEVLVKQVRKDFKHFDLEIAQNYWVGFQEFSAILKALYMRTITDLIAIGATLDEALEASNRIFYGAVVELEQKGLEAYQQEQAA